MRIGALVKGRQRQIAQCAILVSFLVFVTSYMLVVVVEIHHIFPDAVETLIIFILVVAIAALFIFSTFETDRVATLGILLSAGLMFASTVVLKNPHTFCDLILERAGPLLLSFFAVTFTLLLERAAKLLKRAADLATREGKRLVKAWQDHRTLDFVVVQKHRMVALHRRRRILNNLLPLPSALHGMASYYEMVVLDFVERRQTSVAAAGGPSSSWLLGISGMRGVGKTTLLRHVRDSYAYSGSSFSCVFLVGAGAAGGRTVTVDRLQYVLAVNMGLGSPPPQTSDDAARIISTCLQGKTFLLLLDDVRERLDLAAVGLPMPLGHRQKVIFTTRNQAICGEMGCSSIQMECLGEDDAWSLFKDKAGDEIIDAHPHINNLAKKMSAECRGLPSALCALGRAMSTKRDVKEWRYAYDILKRKMRRPPVNNKIQEMEDDDQAYSNLHTLVDELQDSAFF